MPDVADLAFEKRYLVGVCRFLAVQPRVRQVLGSGLVKPGPPARQSHSVPDRRHPGMGRRTKCGPDLRTMNGVGIGWYFSRCAL